jgi:hypothetical protein
LARLGRLPVAVGVLACLPLSARPFPAPSRPGLPAPIPCESCWIPPLQTSWQWQLTVPVDEGINTAMYDVDMFENSASVVSSLHAAGRKVICYISAGTWERFRPDASQFPESVKGKKVDGWPGERWLDIRQLSILEPIMAARMDQCRDKGFDGIEFDNVDGYANDTGFPLTPADQLAFDAWLANEAHVRNLNAALKNDLGQIPQLLPYFDWALDEQCFQYSECGALQAFVSAGKAVMEVEYALKPARFCPQANAMDFNSLKKRLSLDAWRIACR